MTVFLIVYVIVLFASVVLGVTLEKVRDALINWVFSDDLDDRSDDLDDNN